MAEQRYMELAPSASCSPAQGLLQPINWGSHPSLVVAAALHDKECN